MLDIQPVDAVRHYDGPGAQAAAAVAVADLLVRLVGAAAAFVPPGVQVGQVRRITDRWSRRQFVQRLREQER